MKEESMRMPDNYERKQETAVAREISLEEVQMEHLEVGIYKERAGVALQVYQRREKMTKVAPAIIEQELDERILKMESLVGKYDNAPLIDTYLTDSYQFPVMKRQVYMENYAIEVGEELARVLPEFKGI